MTLVHWIWLASLMAAAAFMLGGYLFGAVQRQSSFSQVQSEAADAEHRAGVFQQEATELRLERDESAVRQHDLLQAYQRMTVARDAIANERDTLVRQRDALVHERDGVAAERDAALFQRNTALADRDQAFAQRNGALAEREQALHQRDALVAQRDSVITRHDSMLSEQEALQQDNRQAGEHITRLSKSLRSAESAAQQRLAQLNQERAKFTQQLKHAQNELRKWTLAAEKAEEKVNELSVARRSAEATASAQRVQLDDLKAAEATARARVAEVEAQLSERMAALDALERENARLEAESAPTAERLRASERALEETEKSLHDTLRELDATRQDLEATRRAVADIPALEKVVAERDEFLLEIDTMKRRLERIDALEERVARASALTSVNAELERKLAETTAEVEQLRALALVHPPAANDAVPEPNTDAFTLEGAIAAVAGADGHRVTVVADDLGFPVVGLGAYQEPLAALCGVINEVQQRAREILPLGRVQRITLETEHEVTVSACTDDDADLKLTLATVAAGPAAETAALRQALANVTSALRRDRGTANRRES
ncbi:MAG: hypothetical protein AAFN74_02310 [Myxococcota bacterium]